MSKDSLTGNDLFSQLVQQLHNYADAAVLWIFLKEEADEIEYGAKSGKMSEEQLCSTVSSATVKRSIQRLQETGFITTRVHKNTKTLVTVNREAVLELLRKPIPERLPAVSKKQFAFLDAWNADRAAIAAQQAIDDASQVDGDSSQ